MVFSNVDATPLRYLSSESRHVADDLKLNEPIPKKRKLGSKASMPIVANITEETRAMGVIDFKTRLLYITRWGETRMR